MKDLFDLPFEEEAPEPEPEPHPQPPSKAPAAAGPQPNANARRILSVTELTVRVRDALEQYIGEIWVEGELSNCRVWNTGHLYFTLKDPSSQLRGFMFKSALRY